MTEFSEAMEFEADDMMNGIIEEAQGMSPTMTPLVTLGTDQPAKDLFETFDDGSASENRMKNSGLYHDEALDL